MGGGDHNSDVYRERSTTRSTQHVEQIYASRNLDPKMNPKGVKVRESRDSQEHPESNAIAFFLDETGSMSRVLERIAKGQLGKLMDVLVHGAVIRHPQVLVGAIGDAANNEQAPLQVGQFESDERIDDDMTRVFFERKGGGNEGESYLLAHYWAARHTSMDCWEKRKRKGYLFTIGDEPFLKRVTATEVARYIGDTLQADIPAEQTLAMARETFHVFHVNIREGDRGSDAHTTNVWRGLIGPYLLDLADHRAVCETIAAAIALQEGVIDPNHLERDLARLDFTQDTRAPVIEAVKPFAAYISGQRAQHHSSAPSRDDDTGTHRF